MRIIRVFPSATRATPRDELAVINRGPGLFDQADEVHVSVLFTWDRERAEQLAREREVVAPVRIGGPGLGTRGEAFVPGTYVARGHTITSRGCPNKCWFCSVWKREGHEVRELPIMPGHNVLDDNLLAASEEHIRAVFAMLREQREPVEFSGGWEARRLQPWHVELLTTVRLHQVWFAYDEDADLEPLVSAGKMLREAGLSLTKTGNVSHRVRCYCLVGWPKDSLDAADNRLRTAYANGFLPMAMLFRDAQGRTRHEWRRFQKYWARPASINRMCRDGSKAEMARRRIEATAPLFAETP